MSVQPSRAPGRAPSSLAEVRLGDHLLHLYGTPEERAGTAAELLSGAMARGELALGLGDEASLQALTAALEGRGVDVATAVARGALQLLPDRQQFLFDGAFDDAQVRRAWEVRTEAALSAGFTGLTVAADMGWALSAPPGAERLVAYEGSLGLGLGAHLCGLCQYDRARFPAAVLRALLRCHALVVHGGRLLRNPSAEPPEAAAAPEPVEAELERLLATLHAQRSAEEALRQSEARFRRLAENARDLVFRYRVGPTPGFDYVSPSVLALTGYTPQECYADPGMGSRLVHPDDRARLQAYALDPAPGPLLLRWIRKDGVVVWAELENTVARDAAGRPVAVEGIARDVTGRRSADEATQAAERLAGLGRLAAGLALEINNPLTWMSSNIHFVQEALAALEARGPTGELVELRGALGDVVQGVRRVRSIVEGLEALAGSAAPAVDAAPPPAAPIGAPPAPAGTTTPAGTAAPTRPTAAPRGRLLVVDDEPLVARSVARILSGAHEVTTLTSAREALQRVEAGERWDLVICDLMMPELSGMELWRRLEGSAPDQAARMVFLTGGAYTPDAQAFLATGHPFLEKPIDPAQLRSRAAAAVADSAASAGPAPACPGPRPSPP